MWSIQAERLKLQAEISDGTNSFYLSIDTDGPDPILKLALDLLADPLSMVPNSRLVSTALTIPYLMLSRSTSLHHPLDKTP